MRVQELFSLDGRVTVVTGGSRGLGLEIAYGLGEAGAKVVVTARRQEWLGPAEEELRAAGIDASAFVCDVADTSAVAELAEATRGRYGPAEILVNVSIGPQRSRSGALPKPQPMRASHVAT